MRIKKMSNKERLINYILEDEIYRDWKSNKLFQQSDFDKYCIQHCKDIEELLAENEDYEHAIKKIIKIIENGRYEIRNENTLEIHRKGYDILYDDILKIAKEGLGDDK